MLQITDKGITLDDFNTIYLRLVEQFKQIYGSDVNLDSDTPDGQLLGLFAQELSNVHQAVGFIVQMLDPYQAQGQWLEQCALYAGVVRNNASYTYIDEVILAGIPKTVIPINTRLIDANKNHWIIIEQAQLNELGSARVTVRSWDIGNFTVKVGEQFTLSTIIIGIERITANTASYGGADQESDIQLLRRFMLSHGINNYNDKVGMTAALHNVVGVKKCVVYENITHQTDLRGIPSHSLNVVILGGDEREIATLIAKKKIGGSGLYGSVNTTCHIRGVDRTIYFDRPTKKTITVSMILGRYKTFDDINQQQIIQNLRSLNFDIGEGVYASRIISSVNLTEGFYIKQLLVNNANQVEVGFREYAEITDIEVLIDE